jgi:PPOX class probable F420-dependent enzyme
MEHEQAREFIRANHRAILATRRQEGGIQMSPVLAGVDGEGRVIISTRETAFKTRLLRRDPRVSLCVQNDTFFGAWIQIDGTTEVLSLPEALEPLVDYYRRTNGEHPDWDDYRAAMSREQRVLVRITITHAGPDKHGYV